jgi:4-hydroxy-2-oxoheptanedioate aldolase
MRPNTLREKLKAGEPTISTHIHSTWPSVVEAIGHTGLYDYVEFVAEYAPFDLHDLDNFCRAAELYNMGSMIKVDQSHLGFLAQRGIGAGFSSVLFTDCRSADDVRECVRVARPDTPDDRGLYGVATRRHTYMGYGGSPEYVQALRDTVAAFMIEKKGAVDNLEEILKVPGVDMVQWGGTDYSMSIGRAGEKGHPEVMAARNKVFEMALEAGIPPRAEIQSVDQAKEFLDMGVRHFSIGTDITILHGWWKENGDSLRRAISNANG